MALLLANSLLEPDPVELAYDQLAPEYLLNGLQSLLVRAALVQRAGRGHVRPGQCVAQSTALRALAFPALLTVAHDCSSHAFRAEADST